MLVTPSGIEMLVRLWQKKKALIPMLVTLLGIGDARYAAAVEEGAFPDTVHAIRNRDPR